MSDEERMIIVGAWVGGGKVLVGRYEGDSWEIYDSVYPPCCGSAEESGYVFKLYKEMEFEPHTKSTAPDVWVGNDLSGENVTIICASSVNRGRLTLIRRKRITLVCDRESYEMECAYESFRTMDGHPYGSLSSWGDA